MLKENIIHLVLKMKKPIIYYQKEVKYARKIDHKIRKISQLFFETIPTMKGFINGNYKFSNYNDNEKIQFLINTCSNIFPNSENIDIESLDYFNNNIFPRDLIPKL